MKCIIIYFSQTGNTEKMALAMQKGVRKAAGNCDIVKIKEANPRGLMDYDLIGLGTPLFGPEPGNVAAFINNLKFVGGKHVFVFSTHGTLPAFFAPSIYPKLIKRGLKVIGIRDWYGNCYLSHCPKPYPTDGHPDETDLKEAEAFGQEMVDRSRRISAGETDLILPAPEAQEMPEPPAWIINVFKKMVKFHKEKCLYPKCRLCMENCPMDGIDLTMDPPVVFKPCIDCEFCIKLCPTGAIEAEEYCEKVTPQFYNDMHDSLLVILDEAEASGHFRRLVPNSAIGWETPVSKMTSNKHPKWIIGKGLQRLQ
jgi:flavodoxin/Fe-S-cluster-containing hydrogenase component 2